MFCGLWFASVVGVCVFVVGCLHCDEFSGCVVGFVMFRVGYFSLVILIWVSVGVLIGFWVCLIPALAFVCIVEYSACSSLFLD